MSIIFRGEMEGRYLGRERSLFDHGEGSRSNLFLIGPTGAGKSTAGRILARMLRLRFFDSDREIEVRSGFKISELFETWGEEIFRMVEEDVLSDLTGMSGVVLATGGGSTNSERNVHSISARGTVVYLKVSLRSQLSRLSRRVDRPLLDGTRLRRRSVLRGLTRRNDVVCSSIADLSVCTDGKDPGEVVEWIVSQIKLPDDR